MQLFVNLSPLNICKTLMCRISDLQFSCPKAADFVASTVGIVIRQHAVYVHIRPDCQTVFYIHTHIVNTHTYTHIHKRAYK